METTKTKTSDQSQGAVESAKETGRAVSQVQSQAQVKARELREEAVFQMRDQVDHRSTQAGEQIKMIGGALRQTSEQLRTDGQDSPAQL